MTTASPLGRDAVANPQASDGSACIVIQPNSSLSPKAAAVFFMSMLLVQVVIVTGFWLAMNAWLILPFAGLELSVLAAALLWCQRENRYREVVTIKNGEIAVERGYNEPTRAWQAAVAWARVVTDLPSGPSGKVRLLLSSAGKDCEVGRCLTDADKLALADRLKGLIRQHAY